MALKLGDMLVQADLIKKEQLDKALAEQKNTGMRVGACLIKMGFITEDAITDFLGKQLNVPTVNLSNKEIDPTLLKLIPADTARKFQIMPVQRTGRTLFVAMANPAEVFIIDSIQFLTGFDVKPMVCAETSIEQTIDRLYGTQASSDALKALDAEAQTDSLEVVDKNQ
ncbi:MAG: type II secretion system protein GspE, partial [Candidatus Edwardsbacteria bacterium]|nr:type II secretion system protein GspE [Candidatus Edwardsbacteria bacterium]